MSVFDFITISVPSVGSSTKDSVIVSRSRQCELTTVADDSIFVADSQGYGRVFVDNNRDFRVAQARAGRLNQVHEEGRGCIQSGSVSRTSSTRNRINSTIVNGVPLIDQVRYIVVTEVSEECHLAADANVGFASSDYDAGRIINKYREFFAGGRTAVFIPYMYGEDIRVLTRSNKNFKDIAVSTSNHDRIVSRKRTVVHSPFVGEAVNTCRSIVHVSNQTDSVKFVTSTADNRITFNLNGSVREDGDNSRGVGVNCGLAARS